MRVGMSNVDSCSNVVVAFPTLEKAYKARPSTLTQVKLIALMIVVGAAAMAVAAQSGKPQREPAKPSDDGDGGIAGSPCGLPTSGNCFVAHTTPGCNNFTCCIAVCQADPFCCDQQWDNFCVGDANLICATCGGAGSGYCYSPHSNPTCNDAQCCNFVCAQDPFCCNTQWDSICANAATQMCVCGGLNTGDCFTVHSNPWCNDAGCCTSVCAVNPYCCDVQWDALCVFDANGRCVCGGGDTASCFKAHSHPWCRRSACCNEVCAFDPFCCDVQWDNFCVGDAYGACCPADIAPVAQGNGMVNVDDLLAVINGWGSAIFFLCYWADIAPNGGNGQCNVDDLLFVLNHWGPCQ